MRRAPVAASVPGSVPSGTSGWRAPHLGLRLRQRLCMSAPVSSGWNTSWHPRPQDRPPLPAPGRYGEGDDPFVTHLEVPCSARSRTESPGMKCRFERGKPPPVRRCRPAASARCGAGPDGSASLSFRPRILDHWAGREALGDRSVEAELGRRGWTDPWAEATTQSPYARGPDSKTSTARAWYVYPLRTPFASEKVRDTMLSVISPAGCLHSSSSHSFTILFTPPK